MDVSAHREWMYNRVLPDGVGPKNTFYEGVEIFILHACQLDQFKNEGTIRCPCLICDCLNSEILDEVRDHLYKKGFRTNYFYWTSHGEEIPASVPLTQPPPSVFGQNGCRENLTSYEQMVMDVADPSFSPMMNKVWRRHPIKRLKIYMIFWLHHNHLCLRGAIVTQSCLLH